MSGDGPHALINFRYPKDSEDLGMGSGQEIYFFFFQNWVAVHC